MFEVSQIKMGIIIGRNEYLDRKGICNCGNEIKVNRWQRTYLCDKCENRNFKMISNPSRNITLTIGGAFECVEKDDSSFHVIKHEGKVQIRKNDQGVYEYKFIVGDQYGLKYSLRHKSIEVFQDGKSLELEAGLNKFCRGEFSIPNFFDVVCTEKNRPLFDFCFKKLAKMNDERSEILSRALQRMFKYEKLELFNSIGFKSLGLIWQDRDYLFAKETKPHEILGVPRYLMPYILDLEYINNYTLAELRRACKKIDGNNMKTVLDIVLEESSFDVFMNIWEDFIQLYELYGYKDVKKLVLYLVREVKLQQGIISPREAVTLLRDYVRMSKALEWEHEKFPSSLKKEHDIAMVNYQMRKSELKAKEFKIALEGSTDLSYKPKSKDAKFQIVLPTEPNDLIKEGGSLSHCVASYVDDVIRNKCKILFLRDQDNVDEPLVTIEVRGRIIRQVRGERNRNPHKHELDFVREWAIKKDLELAVH